MTPLAMLAKSRKKFSGGLPLTKFWVHYCKQSHFSTNSLKICKQQFVLSEENNVMSARVGQPGFHSTFSCMTVTV